MSDPVPLQFRVLGDIAMHKVVISKAARCLALAAALLVGSCAAPPADAPRSSAKPRPNILLIISDDIGVDVTSDMSPGLIDGLLKQYGPSGHNHPKYLEIKGRPASTPNLNALARSGIRFTQTWVQPFCANTRSSILSGLYPVSTGVLDYTGFLSQNHRSFVRDLKDKGGYSTAVFGKWHMAGLVPANAAADAPRYPGMKPKEAGFDLFLGNLNGAPSTYHEYDYHVQDATTPADQWRTEKAPTRSLPGIAPTTYAPVVKVADATKWITEQEQRDPDKPWFVWLAFNVAHISENQNPSPMVVPDRDTLDEPSRREMESCGGTFGTRTVGRCTDKQLMRAMTNSMDTVIGHLLKTVDALDPNTYVIYIGDNGTWMFGTGREFIDNMYITRQGRGKGTALESGTRVDLVMRGPRIKAGSATEAIVTGSDLFPTILELAGLDVPKTVPDREGRNMIALDGISLRPAMFDGAQQLRNPDTGYILSETNNPLQNNARQAGARNARYKLVCDENTAAASCRFFDIKDDPLEEYPLAKPAGCANYVNGQWKPSVPEWNFCRLQEVLAQKSFLAAKR
jgi:arylsulfatase A-like enzyme